MAKKESSNNLTLIIAAAVVVVVLAVGVFLFLQPKSSNSSSNSPSQQSSSTYQSTSQSSSQSSSSKYSSSQSSGSNSTSAVSSPTSPVSASPTLLSDTELVVSSVQPALNNLIAPSLPPGQAYSFVPFNTSFQNHQTEQTNFETPSALKAYNPYDPTKGTTNNLLYNYLTVQVFPSIPGGEIPQSYVEVKTINGFLVTYDVQNPSTPAESYDVSFTCYSEKSLGANYVLQASFNQLNYYNSTEGKWDKIGFNDFVNAMTAACSGVS